MKEQVKDYFNRYVKFTDQEIDEIYDNLTPQTFKKKEHLLQQGQVCKKKFFVVKGLIRAYNINDQGIEKITQFALENWWISNMDSFINETPAHTSLQALEQTQVLMIGKDSLEELYSSIPKMERLFRIITENMMIAAQRRTDFYLQLKSKDRYEMLSKHFPNFVQRVPQYMIASYLEITPEYLSSLRANC